MKKIVLSILIFVFTSLPLTSSAAYIPFGGLITAQWACNTGFLISLKTAKGPLFLMWFWGNLPFASRIIPHIGQNILGIAAPITVPCVLGVPPFATYPGIGLPIVYHGSSI